jgi:hypothetical protein
MVPPFNPARQPGTKMCQDGATRRIGRVGSGDLWGHAPICKEKAECQSPNMVPPVSSSRQFVTDRSKLVPPGSLANVRCHPPIRGAEVESSLRASETVPPPSLLGNGHLVRPLGATPNQRAQTSATRRFAVPPEWYHPSVRGAPNSATPQFSWQSVPTRAGATRQPGTTMCQDGATRWIGPSLGPRPSLSPADVRCHPPIRGAEVTFRLVAYSPSDVPVRSPLSPPCLHATLLTVLAGDPELTASRLDEALLPDPVLTPLA